MAKQPTVRLLLHWNNALNLKLELMNLLLLMPAMIERSQALNRMIYLRFSNVNSTHPIEEDIGIKILTAKVSFYNMASVASYIYFPRECMSGVEYQVG